MIRLNSSEAEQNDRQGAGIGSRLELTCDFLVAGAGWAGICAALQAGRLGLRTILVEKEMLLGGNGGPNLGVGAHAAMACNPYWNETGIVEELEEEINWRQARLFPTNFGYNVHPLWDETVSNLLNSAGVQILRRHLVTGCRVEDGFIRRVELLNIENLRPVEVKVAGQVLDATGDAIVAQLAGAKWRMGREARAETGERSAPDAPDAVISTASVTGLVVNTGRPCEFVPPPGTPRWNPCKPDNHFDPSQPVHFLWQVDEGGESAANHSLYTPQELYQRLRLRLFSVWDYLKNRKYPRETTNFQLVWISPILGRRESRRIEGDYLLTQTDIETGRVFADAVGFGGSYLDEHLPSADGGYEVRFYARPLPYDIPFRCLYSHNIRNLFAGGRAVSASHLAFTSVRLMRTGGVLGQAAAVAAKLCQQHDTTPAELGIGHIQELQQELLKHDVFIIGQTNADPRDLARRARVSASSEAALSRPAAAGQYRRADAGIAAAIYAYAPQVERVGFYLRNPGGETTVKAFLGYGETPPPEFWPAPEFSVQTFRLQPDPAGSQPEGDKNAHGQLEGAVNPTGSRGWTEYYRRVDNVTQFAILAEGEATVAAGFEGWIEYVLINPRPFPAFDRTKAGQAVVIGLTGRVEVLTEAHPVDVVEGLRGDSDGWQTDLPATPVFSLRPDPRPGRAENLINGKPQREGRAALNQWMSEPGQHLPQWIELELDSERQLREILLRFDVTERLWRDMYLIKGERVARRLVRDYRLEVWSRGSWTEVLHERDNYRRFRRHELPAGTRGSRVRLIVDRVWDESQPARVYEMRIY